MGLGSRMARRMRIQSAKAVVKESMKGEKITGTRKERRMSIRKVIAELLTGRLVKKVAPVLFVLFFGGCVTPLPVTPAVTLVPAMVTEPIEISKDMQTPVSTDYIPVSVTATGTILAKGFPLVIAAPLKRKKEETKNGWPMVGLSLLVALLAWRGWRMFCLAASGGKCKGRRRRARA